MGNCYILNILQWYKEKNVPLMSYVTYLIGPLAFANAACTKHSNVTTATYTCLSTITNPDSEVRTGKELVYFYGEDNPIDALCKQCKEEQKKEKLTK